MSLFRFIFKSLIYFRGRHLALLAAILVTTAVLTGALIIGDSVRFSLKQLAETRLGKIRYTLVTGGRYVRANLAKELSTALDATSSAALLFQGIAIDQENGSRINRVQVVGIDSGFFNFSMNVLPAPREDEAVVSKNVALQLGLQAGDVILLRVEKSGLIPVNAPFSPETQQSIAFRLNIIAIADDSSLGRFSLKSNQVAPFNIFINRELLAEKMDMEGLSNLILFGENKTENLSPEKITGVLNNTWKPLDAGLLMKELPGTGQYELVSNRVFIDKQLSRVIENLNLPHENILTYLVNSIYTKTNSTPYSFVFAAPSNLLPGKLLPGETVINEWLAADLNVKTGDSISLDYFVIGPFRKLIEKTGVFKVSAISPVTGGIFDSTLMPDFPGLSDAGNCSDWNTGVPVDLKLIRDKDEQYWDRFKGTPKAAIALSSGIEMWKNPFGEYTSIRFNYSVIRPETLLDTLMGQLSPVELGIYVVPLYLEGLSSANNAVDFGQLFLGLSFFIMLAALLLILLIFSLNTSSRNQETAVLSGLGLPDRVIVRLRIIESLIVASIGSILGAISGIFYNFMLVKALNTIWMGAVQTNMLEIYVRPQSIIAGAAIGFSLALVTIIFISRRSLKEKVAILLKVNNQQAIKVREGLSHRNGFISLTGILLSVALLTYSILTGAYEDPVLFLAAGALFLFASIFGIAWLLAKMQRTKDYTSLNISQLALKNAGRNIWRSFTVVLVLAIGVFSIILTGAYRKTFSGTESEKSSGTGGYLFWAETTVPIPFNLNENAVQEKYLVSDSPLSSHIRFEQFHSLEGDDASCLNLNQVIRPRILGVSPGTFNSRGAFSFISLINDDFSSNPWTLLVTNLGNGIIPAFADQLVIQYGLKKSLGDTLYYLDEYGDRIKIVLVGGLENSIFQGNILIDDAQFVKHFPSIGSRVMLIDAPLNEGDRITEIMNQSFMDFGIELTKASQKLAAFNTVENTYLSVFMILGGLGLIIGTIGLAIVLFRNINERKHELALLSALGFTDKHITILILLENIFLFLSGLACGMMAAFISILPSWLSPGFHTQTIPVLIILLLVFMSGVIWIWVPAKSALKGNIIETLKNE